MIKHVPMLYANASSRWFICHVDLNIYTLLLVHDTFLTPPQVHVASLVLPPSSVGSILNIFIPQHSPQSLFAEADIISAFLSSFSWKFFVSCESSLTFLGLRETISTFRERIHLKGSGFSLGL